MNHYDDAICMTNYISFKTTVDELFMIISIKLSGDKTPFNLTEMVNDDCNDYTHNDLLKLLCDKRFVHHFESDVIKNNVIVQWVKY
jgi:hypothetical protein